MPNLPLDLGNLVVSGSKITMEAPHLAGYTPDQRPYELWANTAVQDLTDSDHVELNKLKTRLLMQDGSTVVMDAHSGLFDNKAQTLDLHKEIFLKTSNGYEVHLTQAFVDLAKNTVDSDQHVDVKLTNGTLSADRLHITDSGAMVRFDGNVVMHLDHLDADNSATTEANAAPAEHGNSLFELCRRPPDDRDVVSGGAKCNCDRTAEALPATRYDNDSSGSTHQTH